MAEDAWRNTPVLLSEIEPRHLQLLEKIIQLPDSQRTYLETVIDGLGTGKTAAQRTAAKNAVMTILNITEADVSLIKQIKRLSSVQQLDLRQFVQDQLLTDVEIDSLTYAARIPRAESELVPAAKPAAEVSHETPVSVTAAQPEQVSSLAETTELLEEEIETELAPAPVAEKIQQITAAAEEDTASSEEPPLTSDDTPPAEESPLTQADAPLEVTPSANTIHISVLGKGLVVSSDQAIYQLSEALRQRLGIGFRNVFGLLKSEDPKVIERLDQKLLEELLRDGMVIANVRYPVDYKTHA